MKRLFAALLALSMAGIGVAGGRGGKVEYVGGTVGALTEGPKGRLITTNDEFLIFQSKKVLYSVRWDGINLLEYGQKASRRYALAAAISPLLLMSKSRKALPYPGLLGPGRRPAGVGVPCRQE